ncbi:MAG: transglycosylase SLT domain-containing protein [Bdellovibrionaceae bacterium]|nr:transglycosylase SLT domain-containing protein [Bdellovibrionales bacterium]MCB9086405.1 transglycosylase SLT domain-containing protein [Pseudobdellovibrionaceae bacterium]
MACGLFFVSVLTEAANWQTGWVQNDLADKPAYSGKCENRNFGSWSYPGTAPWGCDADNYGESYRAEIVYAPFTLNLDRLHLGMGRGSGSEYELAVLDRASHLKDYMTQMYLLVRSLAAKYYAQRRPQAPADEVDAWIQAILAVVAQESNFSHFRKVDPSLPLKIVMGDHNQSIGLMQIYLQAHAVRTPDHYFDLTKNILFGMDQFYLSWERAEKASEKCLPVKSRQDQAKAAYSSYNGGRIAICRWSTASALWHQANPGCTFGSQTDYEDKCSKDSNLKFLLHDLHYAKKLSKSPWMRHIDLKPDTELALDVDCLMRGNDLCAISEEQRVEYLSGHILTFYNPEESTKNEYCVIGEDGDLHCIYGDHDVACLNRYAEIKQYNRVYRLNQPDLDFTRITYQNRHFVCQNAVDGLVPVGGFIKTHKAIAIRRGPSRDSDAIGSTENRVFQVIDFFVRPGRELDRYYVVPVMTKQGLDFGYIYAGSVKASKKPQYGDWDRWATPMTVKEALSSEDLVRPLPVVGEWMRVVTETKQPVLADILSSDPHPQAISMLDSGDEFEVLNLELRGDETANKMYLKIRGPSGEVGYLYSGQTSPNYTINRYVESVSEKGVSQ